MPSYSGVQASEMMCLLWAMTKQVGMKVAQRVLSLSRVLGSDQMLESMNWSQD